MGHENPVRQIKEPCPPLDHPSRGFFQQAIREGDIGKEHLARLDYFIEQARRRAETTPSDIICGQIVDYQTSLYETIERSGACSRTDILTRYRLLTMASMLPELVLVPVVFNNPQSTYEQRSRLTEALAGISGEIIEAQMGDFAKAATEEEKERLRGAINEQAALAAINYGDAGEIVALPSLTYEDYQLGIDIMIYTHGDPEPSPLQIKSSIRGSQNGSEIPTVSLGHLNEGFVASRALYGFMNTGHIHPRDAQRVGDLQKALLGAELPKSSYGRPA